MYIYKIYVLTDIYVITFTIFDAINSNKLSTSADRELNISQKS